MNYRHAFHAGGFADVAKHALFVLLIERLKAKDKPFMVLDTHGGLGRYDLQAPAAARTGEYRQGIARLLAAPEPIPEVLRAYVEAVRRLNPETAAGLRWYPGSPRLAADLLRLGDRLVVTELHPEDGLALKREFRNESAVAVHLGDGWTAIKAHLPPRERRGLVLIDPAFEAADEFSRMVTALAEGHRRWPTGQFALWYPIKERAGIWRFHEALIATGIPRLLAAELTVHPEESHLRLNGSGMILVNPPWRFDTLAEEALTAIHHRLDAPGGGVRLDWLAGDS